MKKELENAIDLLVEIEKLNLSKKYMKFIDKGIEPEEIEDFDLYNEVKKVHEAGLTEKLIALQEEKKLEYDELLQSYMADLENEGFTKTDRCLKQVNEGNYEDAIASLKQTLNQRYGKVIKSERDCTTYEEYTEYYKAKRKAPLRTKIFGVKVVSKINKEEISDKEARPNTKKLKVQQVDIEELTSYWKDSDENKLTTEKELEND